MNSTNFTLRHFTKFDGFDWVKTLSGFDGSFVMKLIIRDWNGRLVDHSMSIAKQSADAMHRPGNCRASIEHYLTNKLGLRDFL
ncbi:hypothetical protein ACPUER_06790 [Burkholderia sp. DN3021]|uniref:hypothetical protein n=1 Tax=Burkholderia sp. DN3021 TaxID=3410137 RepID=UPI003C7D36E0